MFVVLLELARTGVSARTMSCATLGFSAMTSVWLKMFSSDYNPFLACAQAHTHT
jgi:hypothetical protein